jgi:2-methylisocitrate lyase-like PEP mutase family enzyme
VNVLVGSDDSTVARLRDLGVRRISTGGALARAAWTGFLAAARDIAAQGAFGGLRHIVGGAELNALFAGRSRDPGATNTGGEGLTTKPEG